MGTKLEMPERYKELSKHKRCRRFKTCGKCQKISLVLVEGDSVFDDALYWQSEHSSKAHPDSKPIIEIVAEWMALRGVTAEQLKEEVQKVLDAQLEKLFQ